MSTSAARLERLNRIVDIFLETPPEYLLDLPPGHPVLQAGVRALNDLAIALSPRAYLPCTIEPPPNNIRRFQDEDLKVVDKEAIELRKETEF